MPRIIMAIFYEANNEVYEKLVISHLIWIIILYGSTIYRDHEG